MIYSKYSGRAVSILVFLPMILAAQRTRESVVPLKNWATPLYWRPNLAERNAIAKPTPQLQFSPTAVSRDALIFVAVTPCRLVDTRGAAAGFMGDSPFSGPSIAGGGTATFPVQSASQTDTTAPAPCGVIPPIAEAYSLNLTVVPHSGGVVGYVTLWPAGATQPFVATLNDGQGLIVNNAAIVPAGTPSGGVSVYDDGPATIDVVIDMNGFFAAPTDVNDNTAIGLASLADNDGGADNTATGAFALTTNTSGTANTASGYNALASNTSGMFNTASGVTALASNTNGAYNTAAGAFALQDNIGGGQNTAIGYTALENNTSGSNNIALGYLAAFNAPVGNSDSIYIGSSGTSSDVSGSIQIGTQSSETTGTIQIGSAQTGGTYIAGIYGGTPNMTNSPVCIDSTGLLGTNCGVAPSSVRFKEEIADMGDSSSNLLQLRPVTFFYKPQFDDGSHSLQYGLIAEEVAKLYPEMVGYDKTGRPSSVKYQWLAPMLLNELQKQAAENQRQAEQIRSLEDRLAALEAGLSKGSPDGSPSGTPVSPDAVR